MTKYGPIAQLGERTVRIRKVVGSIPIRSTKREPYEPGSDYLHGWRRVHIGLSVQSGKMKKGYRLGVRPYSVAFLHVMFCNLFRYFLTKTCGILGLV